MQVWGIKLKATRIYNGWLSFSADCKRENFVKLLIVPTYHLLHKNQEIVQRKSY